MGEHIVFAEDAPHPTAGSAGLATQLPGAAATVGNLARATGGIGPGRLVSSH